MTLVVDASLLVRVLVQSEPVGKRARDSLRGEDLHAPELIDLEVASSLRRLVARGEVGARRAAAALELLSAAPVARYPHAPLLRRIWELRSNVTAYDAAYVALAEALGCRLVTSDGGLANAPGPRCRRELVP